MTWMLTAIFGGFAVLIVFLFLILGMLALAGFCVSMFVSLFDGVTGALSGEDKE